MQSIAQIPAKTHAGFDLTRFVSRIASPTLPRSLDEEYAEHLDPRELEKLAEGIAASARTIEQEYADHLDADELARFARDFA